MNETVQEIGKRISSYVALDLETTGLDPKQDRIIEIGAVKVVDELVTEEFSAFVNPRMEIKEAITKLTGITEAMVKNAPPIEDTIGPILDFCGDFPILGHHIIFDYSFLKKAAVNKGLNFERTGVDTLSICRKFMPEGEKKNLKSACAYFGIVPEGTHRALADAKAAHLLYRELLKSPREETDRLFLGKPLIYRVKKEQLATKKQKQGLRELAKYHKINLSVQVDSMTRNEVSRMTDKIILQYGRIKR